MYWTLLLLTVLHLTVDGICGATLADYALEEPRMAPIIFYFSLYTILAFGLQGPVGWLLDVFPKALRPGLPLATLCLGLGCIVKLGILSQVIFLGMGNCLFHVVGGSYVLRSYTSFRQLGLFVCSGAIGLGLGLNCLVRNISFFVLTIIFAAITFALLPKAPPRSMGLPHSFKADCEPVELLGCAFLLLFCIVLRGFGSNSPLDLGNAMLLPFLLALGKLLGGIVGDMFGYRNTVLLIFALGFVALQLRGEFAGMLFLLACNMTMPLTLRLAHWCKLNSPGLMFGVAASCLVPGSMYKELMSLPQELILVLQFVILALVGFILIPQEKKYV